MSTDSDSDEFYDAEDNSPSSARYNNNILITYSYIL